jgi:hypothetical protein
MSVTTFLSSHKFTLIFFILLMVSIGVAIGGKIMVNQSTTPTSSGIAMMFLGSAASVVFGIVFIIFMVKSFTK